MNKEQALQACTVEGLVVKLPPEQLERKVYQEVAKSLQLIGGKWIGGKVFGFQFQEDPTELLAQVANGEKRNLQKEFQFYPTPDAIADWLVSLAHPKRGELILEPSAGQGAIIKAIFRYCPTIKHVDCCELMPINQTFLDKIDGALLIADDFLEMLHYHENVYDCIIANPPFAKNQDIDHIRQMYRFLKPGGRLVTIASQHWRNCTNKKETEFREWLKGIMGLGQPINIEAGAFRESGTMVGMVVITLTKPANVQAAPAPLPEAKPKTKSKTKPTRLTHAELATIKHQDRKERIIDSMQRLIKKAIEFPIRHWNGQLTFFEEFVNQQSNSIWDNPKRLAECTSEFISQNGFNDSNNGKPYDFLYGTGSYCVGQASMLPMVLYRIKKDWGNGVSKVAKTKPIPNADQINKLNDQVYQKALETGTLPMPEPEPEPKKKGRKKTTKAPIPAPPVPQAKASVPQEKETTQKDGLTLVQYSIKCFALFGNTKPIKNDLLNLGGAYCRFLTHNNERMGGWVFSVKREKQLKLYLAS
jgi:phospholipid N-methyltransferase